MKPKKKIYQLFNQYSEFYQPYIPPVISALREQKGFQVKIVAFNGDKRKDNEVIILPHYRKRKIIANVLQRLKKKYRNLDYFEIKALRDKVDIIHIQHSYLHSKVIHLLERLKEKRPKIIITLRGGDTYVKPWIGHTWKDFYKEYGDKVDAFITMSEHQRQYLHTKWGVDKERIHVIPISFGAPFEVLPKTPAPDTLNLVSVFRLCWEKNIAGNLQFVKALKDRNIPVTYSIYGDGPDLGQVYYLRDQYGLTEEVRVLGKEPNATLKEKLGTYDFILQLSYSESLGMSVIEAQSFGVPAIVSDNGGLSEMIINGKNGVVVDLKNMEVAVQEVISVWNHSSLYSKLSQNSIKHAHKNFTIQSEVDKLITLYKSIV